MQVSSKTLTAKQHGFRERWTCDPIKVCHALNMASEEEALKDPALKHQYLILSRRLFKGVLYCHSTLLS